MTLYRVTMTGEKLIALIGNNLGAYMVESIAEDRPPRDEVVPQQARYNEAPRTRKPRGSKVNEAIISKLRNGSSSLKELRGALETVGLAPNSVSTGLALLQKSGQVERIGDGVYALKQAAE